MLVLLLRSLIAATQARMHAPEQKVEDEEVGKVQRLQAERQILFGDFCRLKSAGFKDFIGFEFSPKGDDEQALIAIRNQTKDFTE